jgi:hypothetical protein
VDGRISGWKNKAISNKESTEIVEWAKGLAHAHHQRWQGSRTMDTLGFAHPTWVFCFLEIT